jgi:hypothetical protein
MYPVSSAYLAAIATDVRESRISGTITLVDDTVINITDEDIVQGSLYFTEQSVSGDDLDVGSVYAAEMGLSLLVPLEDPYALDGARIALQYGILTAEPDTWEYVPLGVYYVTDITRAQVAVGLKALDGMIRLDVDLSGIETSGSPWLLLSAVAAKTGITLLPLPDGLPNTTATLIVPPESEIKTCRDLVMWICQATGSFARMDRLGRLEIVMHGTGEPVRDIAATERYTSKVSDDKVKIANVEMSIGEDVYAWGPTGPTMTLTSNPLMASMDGTDITDVLAGILEVITDVEYVPYETDTIGDPALQPGDRIRLLGTGSLDSDGDVVSIITHSTWRYRGRHTLRGAGKTSIIRHGYSQQAKAITAARIIAQAAQNIAIDANAAAEYLNNAIGGNILIRQDGETTNEILIMDHPDPDQAVKIWRWNMGGLGYSDNVTGADNPAREYTVAMTMDGAINAIFVKTGKLSADVVSVGPGTTFEASEIYTWQHYFGMTWQDVIDSWEG